MTIEQHFTCLNAEQLARLAESSLLPAEVEGIEEHVNQCKRCRELLETRSFDLRWQTDVLPGLLIAREAVQNQQSEDTSIDTILKLLGPTDDPEMLGRIAGYEVMGVIGRGGMGIVLKALDRALNRIVAIKMLLPHLAASGAARKRFEREGQAAAAVIDDYVLPIYAVSEWRETPYLVTQYLRGDTLQKRIYNSGSLELREVLRIGMQTARGLAAAHAQGLVHRDVKPSNILLDGAVSRAMLTDFGLARAVDDASMTATGVVAGTPQYMSPEQARAEIVDQRSDLFSLGSVLYAMSTGHPPFRAESSLAVLRLISDKQPSPIREINPDIPEWLCAIVAKLMHKKPEDRFDSAAEVAELLQACLAHVQQPRVSHLPKNLRSVLSDGSSKKLTGVLKMFLSKFGWLALSCVGLMSVLVITRPDGLSTEEGLAALQGEWQLKAMEREGEGLPADQLFNERLIIDGTQFSRLQTKPDGGELKGESGRISVAVDRNQKTIDFHLFEGTIYGIYEQDGDELKICITRQGGARPDVFKTRSSDFRVLQRFTRKGKAQANAQSGLQQNKWIDNWLSRIPTELPQDAADAQAWMKKNQFEDIRFGDLTPEVAKQINPDIQPGALEQAAKKYLFGRLNSPSRLPINPYIEVYCFVNESNAIVGMQVSPGMLHDKPRGATE